jgi:hypothetical protein
MKKEEADAQEGAIATIGSMPEERSGSLKSMSKCVQGSAQGRESDLGRHIEHRGPTSIRFRGRHTEFNLWKSRRRVDETNDGDTSWRSPKLS